MKLLLARKGRRNRRAGVVMVEAAVVLPFIILMLFGVLEYGRYIMMRQQLTNAAREGARYAVAHTQPVTIGGTTFGNATSDVTTQITQKLASLALQGQAISVYESDSSGNNIGVWNDTKSGEWVCVRITGNFPVIASGLLFLPPTLPITTQVIMRSEAN
jgi:Flp pilus assembly protein TadG